METKDFIEKTNNIVKLLMRAAGENDFITAASITTAQADMNCDALIEYCNSLIGKIKREKVELMGLREKINSTKEPKDFKTTWDWIATFEDGTPEWREAMNICQKYYKKYNNPEPIEYLDQIIEEHNKWKNKR